MKCGRRGELGGGPFNLPNEDHWREDGTCSYCGSLQPELLFAAIEAGEEIGPTDKSYKLYVKPGHRKFYFQHLDEAGRARFIELNNAGKINYGYPGYLYARPYFARVVSHDYEPTDET